MKLTAVFFCLILTILSQDTEAQVDDIEYNLWEQIYDFKIENNRYFFMAWDTGEIIEEDTLLFDVNIFFSNYPAEYKPDYLDSVQFTIASRTLKKSYGEKILHDKKNEFIRICWLKENYQVILKLEELKNENIKISLKIGNGNYERHGNVLYDSMSYLSKKESKKIQKLINMEFYRDLKNGVICQDELHLPNVFFFEFIDGEEKNIIVISECNLESSNYKDVFDLYVISKAIFMRKKVVPDYYWE
jgi:hypothetical protein